jgi:hypothetical protein
MFIQGQAKMKGIARRRNQSQPVNEKFLLDSHIYVLGAYMEPTETQLFEQQEDNEMMSTLITLRPPSVRQITPKQPKQESPV